MKLPTTREREPSPLAERMYCSAWHLLIVGVGLYEFKNHKSWLSKVLSVGLIAFHTDGAIADLLDRKPVSRQVLDGMVKTYESRRKPLSGHEVPPKTSRRIR